MLPNFRNESCDDAVACSPDVDAVLKPWTADDGLRVGGIENVIAVDGNVRGTSELLVLRNELTVLIEHLDTVVAAVGDEHAARAVHHHRVKAVEFARSLAVLSPCLDEFPVPGELHDALVGVGTAVAVCDEDVSIRRLDDVGGGVEGVGTAAGVSWFAEREDDFP